MVLALATLASAASACGTRASASALVNDARLNAGAAELFAQGKDEDRSPPADQLPASATLSRKASWSSDVQALSCMARSEPALLSAPISAALSGGPALASFSKQASAFANAESSSRFV